MLPAPSGDGEARPSQTSRRYPPLTTRSAALAIIATLVFAFSWLFRFNNPSGSFAGLTDDHFFYLVRGWQILFGDLPVRDFVDQGAPLYYYVAAAVQILFGRGTLSEIVFSVTVLSACATAVFLLGVRVSGSIAIGLAAALFHILLEPRLYNYPKILVYVVAIPALWAFADRPSSRRRALLAAITVVAFLFRHDHGVFVGAAFAALLVLLPGVPWRARLRHFVLYALLTSALLSPYLAFIQMNGGVVSYFRQASAWAERDRARAEVVWPGLFDNPDGTSEAATRDHGLLRAVDVIHDNYVAWLFYIELALPVIVLLTLAVSGDGFRRGWPLARTKVATVAVLALVLDAGFLRSPLAARLADPSVPHALLLAWLAATVAALVPSLTELAFWGRPAAALRVTLVGMIAALLLVTVVTAAHDWQKRLDRASLLQDPDHALEAVRHVTATVRQDWTLHGNPAEGGVLTLTRYLNACTKPTDRVFIQDYLPEVIGLAQRGFAGGHADLRPGFFTSDDMQQLTVRRLEHQSVPVVVLSAGENLEHFRRSFPLVTAYFDAQYTPMGDRALDERFSVHLLAFRRARPTGHYAPLDLPCFR